MLDIVTDRTYHSDQDCDVDCRLLEESGLLDVTAYCAAAGLEDGAQRGQALSLAWLACESRAEPEFRGEFPLSVLPERRTRWASGPDLPHAAGGGMAGLCHARAGAGNGEDHRLERPLRCRRLRGTSRRSRRPRPCVALRPGGRANGARAVHRLRSRILSRSQSRCVRRRDQPARSLPCLRPR